MCPMDRQVTGIGSGGVWGLKKNFALIELMEKLQLGGVTHLCELSATSQGKGRRAAGTSSQVSIIKLLQIARSLVFVRSCHVVQKTHLWLSV